MTLGHAGDDVGKISLRIEPVELRRLCRPPNYAEQTGFPQDSRDRALIGSA
jgi:hypothetical protein